MWIGDRPYQVDLCRCNIELAARALAYFCSFAVTLCWIRGVAELGTSWPCGACVVPPVGILSRSRSGASTPGTAYASTIADLAFPWLDGL